MAWVCEPRPVLGWGLVALSENPDGSGHLSVSFDEDQDTGVVGELVSLAAFKLAGIDPTNPLEKEK